MAGVLSSRDPAVAAVRGAVRALLTDARDRGLLDDGVLLAVSGGADSLALAAVAAPLAASLGVPVRALVVDHGLQPGSAEVAATAVRRLHALGVPHAGATAVTVTGGGGPEAAARRARYAALTQAAAGALVLLGHTRDDQAETVLLGLGRGSGPRSVAGMATLDPPWARPLLTVSRADTRAACDALGVEYWNDPHNADPAFTRVRLRAEVLPLLENVLHGGVAAALARTAAQLREDNAVLDRLAAELHRSATDGDALQVAALVPAEAAVRKRALRAWLLGSGVAELTAAQLGSVDDLVGKWRGQGGVCLPGGFMAARAHGRLTIHRDSVGGEA